MEKVCFKYGLTLGHCVSQVLHSCRLNETEFKITPNAQKKYHFKSKNKSSILFFSFYCFE